MGRRISKSRPAKAPKKHTVIHLGNIRDRSANIEKTVMSVLRGKQLLDENPGAKTKKYAERFPNVEFVGIDLKEHTGARPKNWRQIQTDFKKGLEELQDNSVSVISSEMALGFYGKKGKQYNSDRKQYTLETTAMAYRKLKPGGKLLIVISYDQYFSEVFSALLTAGFTRTNIQTRRLQERERKRTYWTNTWRFSDLIQIVAIK